MSFRLTLRRLCTRGPLCALLLASAPALAWQPQAPPQPQQPKHNQQEQPQQDRKKPVKPLIRIRPFLSQLGVMSPRSTRVAEVLLRNDGDAPAVLRRVATTCTCTATNFHDPVTIEPGAEHVLKLQVRAGNNIGPLKSEAHLFFEHQADPMIVRVEAKVARPVSANPPIIDVLIFPKRNPKPPLHGTITLKSEDGKPFRVLTVQGKPAPANEPALTHTVEYNFEGVEQRDMPIWFVVETDHPQASVVELRVGSLALLNTGQGTGPWDPDFDLVNLGRITPGDSAAHEIELVGLRDTNVPVEFLSMKGLFAIEVVAEHPGAKGRVFVLKCTPALGQEGLLHDKLVIRAKGHERAIDMYASVRP